MSNVEMLRQAGVDTGGDVGQRLESLSEDEMASLVALCTTEPRDEVLWDNQGWADQTRSFLDA